MILWKPKDGEYVEGKFPQCPKKALFRIQTEGQFGIEDIDLCNSCLTNFPNYCVVSGKND